MFLYDPDFVPFNGLPNLSPFQEISVALRWRLGVTVGTIFKTYYGISGSF